MNNMNNSNFSLEKQTENENMKYVNNNYHKNSSGNSSGIINNEDSILYNKRLLNNYYNNYNNNENNKKENNDINNLKDLFNDKKFEKENNHSNIGVKIEFPSCDKEIVYSNIDKKLFNSKLNKTFNNKKKIKKFAINLKNKIIKKNKTIEFLDRLTENKDKQENKISLEINKSNIGIEHKSRSKNINKNNLNKNKSYNNIKEYKLFKGKINGILRRKIEVIKNRRVINKNKLFQKNNTFNINEVPKLIKNWKSNFSLVQEPKKKPMYASNANFIISLLNIKQNNYKNTIPASSSNIRIKAKNPEKKLINKKNYINPFTTIEKNHYKSLKIKKNYLKYSYIH